MSRNVDENSYSGLKNDTAIEYLYGRLTVDKSNFFFYNQVKIFRKEKRGEEED
ncbi:MAG: hypothetical protein NC400_06465 [Clostridium sp.]|nr:hypothetical protein [Clostridium sp.]